MKLTDYQLPEKRRIAPTFRVNRKGLISLSTSACEILGVKPKEEIIISYDADTRSIFIRKGSAAVGRKLILKGNPNSKTLQVMAIEVADDIFKWYKVESSVKALQFPINREPKSQDGKNYYQVVMTQSK